MNKYDTGILLDGNIVEPVNCSAIILGDRRQKINPITNTVIENDDGIYLWRIDQPRNCGHFLLAYENSRYPRD